MGLTIVSLKTASGSRACRLDVKIQDVSFVCHRLQITEAGGNNKNMSSS